MIYNISKYGKYELDIKTAISHIYLNAQQIYKSFYGCLIRAQMYQKDMAVIYLWQRH